MRTISTHSKSSPSPANCSFPHSDAISTAATQVYASWVALIRARLEDEGVASSRARTAAVAAVAAIEGALVLSKSSRDTTALRQAETYLRDLLS